MYRYLVFIFMFPAIAYAGDTDGTISEIFIHYQDDKVAFRIVSSSPNFASCATTNRYVVETTSQAGRNIYSAILSAKASLQTVFIKGSGNCNVHGDAETVLWMTVK